MIEYLSAFLNAYLTENLLELGLTTGMVESLVRGGLILLVLLLSWVAHRVSQGPINRSVEKLILRAPAIQPCLLSILILINFLSNKRLKMRSNIQSYLLRI